MKLCFITKDKNNN